MKKKLFLLCILLLIPFITFSDEEKEKKDHTLTNKN